MAYCGVDLLALALALSGSVVLLWAISGKMVFAAVVTLCRCHLSDFRLAQLRLITSKERYLARRRYSPKNRCTNARLNGGRFGDGYAWLVSPCTCVLPQVRVPNRNSTRRSTKDAHALKLLATQRGNVRSSNIAAYSRGIWGPTAVQVPREGFLNRYRSSCKAQVFVSTAGCSNLRRRSRWKSTEVRLRTSLRKGVRELLTADQTNDANSRCPTVNRSQLSGINRRRLTKLQPEQRVTNLSQNGYGVCVCVSVCICVYVCFCFCFIATARTN